MNDKTFLKAVHNFAEEVKKQCDTLQRLAKEVENMGEENDSQK